MHWTMDIYQRSGDWFIEKMMLQVYKMSKYMGKYGFVFFASLVILLIYLPKL